MNLKILNHPLQRCCVTTKMATTNHRQGAKNNWHPFHTIGNKKIKLVEGEDLFLCCKFVSQICDNVVSDSRSRRDCGLYANGPVYAITLTDCGSDPLRTTCSTTRSHHAATRHRCPAAYSFGNHHRS